MCVSRVACVECVCESEPFPPLRNGREVGWQEDGREVAASSQQQAGRGRKEGGGAGRRRRGATSALRLVCVYVSQPGRRQGTDESERERETLEAGCDGYGYGTASKPPTTVACVCEGDYVHGLLRFPTRCHRSPGPFEQRIGCKEGCWRWSIIQKHQGTRAERAWRHGSMAAWAGRLSVQAPMGSRAQHLPASSFLLVRPGP